MPAKILSPQESKDIKSSPQESKDIKSRVDCEIENIINKTLKWRSSDRQGGWEHLVQKKKKKSW